MTTYSTRHSVGSDAYVDLGAGPLLLQNLSLQTASIVAADAQPAADVVGHVLASSSGVERFECRQHLFARAMQDGAAIVVAATPTGLDSPAEAIVAVAPDDNVDLPNGVCRALLVGTAGTVNIVDSKGNVVTGVPLQQGYNPLRVARVKTGGTASSIFALY